MRTAPFVLAAALLLAGCSNLNKTEQRVLSGSAIGAATGAAATVMTGGCVGCGAAIGGAVGAGAGYVVDQMEK
ncbi:MAG: hypothetical protein GC131_00095 [Alphaproteobacteria bacterium]|nr:hypothetical protein [Alphaproteobacteria bacterium]